MKKITCFIITFLLITIGCKNNSTAIHQPSYSSQAQTVAIEDTLSPKASFALKLSATAISLTNDKVDYDPAYFSIKYPNGDVPADKGVCTDVVIRAYRKLGIDLQKEVHEDMATHIGIVVNKLSDDKQRYLIVHNIGRGQVLSDCLFEFVITGHYSYEGN